MGRPDLAYSMGIRPTQGCRDSKMSIRFRFDWVEAPPYPDEFASRAMAELSVEAQDEMAISVRHRENGTFRNHVAVQLSGIAERLIGNWRRIICEIDDAEERKPGFESGRNLAIAGDGFVPPNLVMIPSQGKINPRRKRYQPRCAAIDFLDEGETGIECEDLEAQFRFLVEAAFERLRGEGSILDALERGRSKIDALDPEEREFCRAAALPGPFEIPNSPAAVRSRENAAYSLRGDAPAAGSAEAPPASSERLARSLREIQGVENGNDRADMRRYPHREPSAPPCEQGPARSVQSRLAVGNGRFDSDSSGSAAVPSGRTQFPSPRRRTRRGGRTRMGHRPEKRKGISARPRRLLERPGSSLLNSLATIRQNLSKASSAEFLAHAESIRRRLNDGFAEADEADNPGREFDVSSEAMRRQGRNHRLGIVAGW